MAHERDSAYCSDFNSEVPELLSDLACELGDQPGPAEYDRVAALLYGRSAELREAVRAWFDGGGYTPERLAAVLSAMKQAAELTETEVSS